MGLRNLQEKLENVFFFTFDKTTLPKSPMQYIQNKVI